jgi:hypothetical protein
MRFSFTPEAEFDIDQITSYLQGLPQAPALRIGRSFKKQSMRSPGSLP